MNCIACREWSLALKSLMYQQRVDSFVIDTPELVRIANMRMTILPQEDGRYRVTLLDEPQ